MSPSQRQQQSLKGQGEQHASPTTSATLETATTQWCQTEMVSHVCEFKNKICVLNRMMEGVTSRLETPIVKPDSPVTRRRM